MELIFNTKNSKTFTTLLSKARSCLAVSLSLQESWNITTKAIVIISNEKWAFHSVFCQPFFIFVDFFFHYRTKCNNKMYGTMIAKKVCLSQMHMYTANYFVIISPHFIMETSHFYLNLSFYFWLYFVCFCGCQLSTESGHPFMGLSHFMQRVLGFFYPSLPLHRQFIY